jgi:hypothetical protein
MGSAHEEDMLGVIDVLLDAGGSITSADVGFGEVLYEITRQVFAMEGSVAGTSEYKRTSLAILALEEMGLVEVDRERKKRAEKANTLMGVYLL